MQPPRLQIGFASIKINLPDPPTKSEDVNRSWLLTLLPMSSMLFMGIFYVFIFSGRGSDSGYGIIFAIPMLLMGVFTAILSLVMYGEQKHQQKISWIKQVRDYQRMLDKKEARIMAINKLQKDWLLSNHPDISQCLHLGQMQSLALWEKKSSDHDFLAVRLGLGSIPSMVDFQLPDPDHKSPLIRKALRVYSDNHLLTSSPVVINLLQLKSIGIIGNRQFILPFVYNLIAQLILMHSPEDVELFVFSTTPFYRAWRWARWIPHTSKNHQGGNPDNLAFSAQQNIELFGDLVNILENLRQNSNDDEAQAGKVRTQQENASYKVCIFDHPQGLSDDANFSMVFDHANKINLISIFLSDSYENVPGACQGIISLEPTFAFEFAQVGEKGLTANGTADIVTLAQIDRLSRNLLPISARYPGQSNRVPSEISLLDIYNVKQVNDFHMTEKWGRVPDKNGLLPYPVRIGSQSLSEAQTIHIAENRDGPHGMIAGTTGSGKSELLQTLVSAMAIEHHPYLVNFLLIDFKGGSTFSAFKDLPHLVGLVSNLDKYSALRALEAIRAENYRRQRFLANLGIEDINDYHKNLNRIGVLKGDWVPLPHLCIIVDEFAELAKDLPDFLPELVSTVRVGRSLGLHLILATQRPAGVVNDEMRANLNFRICLRVQTQEDSRDMLHRPDAARLSPNIPGRAYFQIGDSGTPMLFQTARVGIEILNDELIPETEQPRDILIYYHNELEENLLDETEIEHANNNQAVINVLSDLVNQAQLNYRTLCEAEHFKALPSVLLDELPKSFSILSHLKNITEWKNNFTNWHGLHDKLDVTSSDQFAIPIGFIDDLEHRSQPVLWLSFKNTALVGNPTSGKTNFLKAIAMSLSYCYSPDDVHIYILSFSTKFSNELLNLPHTGDIIFGEELEKVDRLMRFLTKEIEKRRNALEGQNWETYQQNFHSVDFPAIMVLIDNFGDLRQQDQYYRLEALSKLIQDGPVNGIFFFITALRINDIPFKDFSIIQQRLALSQSELIEFIHIVGKLDSLGTCDLPPGRGYIRLENRVSPQLFQLACVEDEIVEAGGSGKIKPDSITQIDAYFTYLNQIWKQKNKPQQIKLLESQYHFSEYYADKVSPNGTTILGVDDSDLQPFTLNWVEDGLHYLIVGPPRSGRTNLIENMILGLTKQYRSDEMWIVLVDGTQFSLDAYRSLPHVVNYITNETELITAIAFLSQELNFRMSELKKGNDISDRPRIFLFIDDYDIVREAIDQNGNALGNIAPYMRRDGRLRFHVIITSVPQLHSDAVIRQIKMRRSGFSLMNDEGVDAIGGRVPSSMRNLELIEGRGFFVQRGSVSLIQFLMADKRSINDAYASLHGQPRAFWEFTPDQDLLEIAETQQKQNIAFATQPDSHAEEIPFSSMFDISQEEILKQYINLKKQQKNKEL